MSAASTILYVLYFHNSFLWTPITPFLAEIGVFRTWIVKHRRILSSSLASQMSFTQPRSRGGHLLLTSAVYTSDPNCALRSWEPGDVGEWLFLLKFLQPPQKSCCDAAESEALNQNQLQLTDLFFLTTRVTCDGSLVTDPHCYTHTHRSVFGHWSCTSSTRAWMKELGFIFALLRELSWQATSSPTDHAASQTLTLEFI